MAVQRALSSVARWAAWTAEMKAVPWADRKAARTVERWAGCLAACSVGNLVDQTAAMTAELWAVRWVAPLVAW